MARLLAPERAAALVVACHLCGLDYFKLGVIAKNILIFVFSNFGEPNKLNFQNMEQIYFVDIEIEEVEEDVEVPFAVIENVPVFPGCKGSNSKKKKCMSEKIAKFVQRRFNTDLAGDLGLSGRQRINVIFKIDKRGNVTSVRARAPHPRLEKEAVRVIKLLPKFEPGKQRGKAVIVPYSLPIIFQVQD